MEYIIKSHKERVSLFKEFLKENGDLLKEFMPKYYVSSSIFRYSEKDQDEIYLKSDLGNHQTPYVYVGLGNSPYIVFYTHVAKKDSKGKDAKKRKLRQKAIKLLKDFISIHPEYEIYNRLKRRNIEHSEKEYNELENWAIHPPKIQNKRELKESLKLMMILFYNYLAPDVTKTKNKLDYNSITNAPYLSKKFIPRKLFLTRNKPMNTRCSKVIIVGPYPTEGFIQRVKDQLNPKRICVVTDSSWKEDEIDKIINLTDVVRKVQTAGFGIVHAKMYYVEYSNKDVQLFFGSVNASENSVDNNSEFISSFWLHSFSQKNQNRIKEYFTNLENGNDARSSEIRLKSYSTLLFPEISVCSNDRENSFRNWIRKGYFYIGYDPDPKFGAMDISLKANKMRKGDLEKMLKGTPLANEKGGVKSSLSWHYAKSNTSRTSSKTEHWKDQYGVKTDLGCWISSDCIKELNKEKGISKRSGDAIPPPSIERKNIVEYIKQMDVNNQKEANKIDIGIKFYELISGRKKLMEILDLPPKEKFLESLKDRIIYHKNLLNDDVYRNRYLTKYAKIPASALNEDYLDKIIVDFIDSYNIKSIKGKKDKLVEEVKKLKDLPINEKKDKIEDLWKQCPELFINYYKKK